MTDTMFKRLRAWALKNPIERPSAKAVDGIDAVIQDIRDAEESLRFLRKRLDDEVRNVREKASDDQELRAAANYIYWMLPEVSSRTLIEAIEQRKGASGVLLQNWVKPIPTVCERCGAEDKVRCRTREDLHKLISGNGNWDFVCDDCRTKQKNEALVEHKEFMARFAMNSQAKREVETAAEQALRQAQERRLWELRRMPYAEYLQTPEWKGRRVRHLESVGHRCQLCNAQGPGLQIHHRNYERRGEERFTDLLVLCRHCHDHHHNG